MIRLARSLTLIALLASTAAAAEVPFPTNKTQTLRKEFGEYYVEGRQVIPKNVSITSLRQMKLVGRGENPTLVVEGVLDLRAVTGGWARIENLRIELAPTAKELVLMDVELGRGAKLVPSDAGPAKAKVSFNGSKILHGGSFEVLMDAGKVAVMASLTSGPMTIRGAMRSETKGSNLDVVVVTNKGPNFGIRGGLVIEGARDVTVRLSDLAGERVRLENNEKLAFDTSNVRCEVLEFRHERAGRLPKAKIEACDFRCDRMLFVAPAKKEGKTGRLAISKSWFGGRLDEDLIRTDMIRDAEVDPESGIEVVLRKISEVPLGLGGRLESPHD